MNLIEWLKNKMSKEKQNYALQELENVLNNTLIPLEPDPHFTNNLRKSLLRQIPEVELKSSPVQHQALQTGLIVTGGILGGVLVIITSIRGFISIIGLTGLILNHYRDNVGGSSLPTTEVLN